MKERDFAKISVGTHRTAKHHMSKDNILHKKKECGLIGTEIIQRYPTVAIESTALHNKSNP